MKKNLLQRADFVFTVVQSLIIAVFVSLFLVDVDITASAQSPSSSLITSTVSSNVRVTDVYKYGHEEKNDKNRNSAGIGDIIVIKVNNLKALLIQAQCVDESNQKVQDCQEKEIALYLEGREIKGIVSVAREPEEGRLQFRLQRNIDNDEAWVDLLGAPPLDSRFFKRPTQVSVGLEGGHEEPTDIKGDRFQLTRIRGWQFWVSFIGILVLVGLMIWLARDSDILRDIGPTLKDKRKPYSLARCQMAFWFFLAIISFVFIWQITGAYDIITEGVLGLIGIGAGTALGAAVIDLGKRGDIASQISTLETEIAELEAKIKATPAPADLDDLKKRKTTKEADLESLKKAVEPETQGFLIDILTDASGGSFHRYQMFAWTIVLGFLFIASVYTRLSMPEFSATLLALLGISAGTYLGFKIPEKQT